MSIRPKILVVEDSIDDAHLIDRILRKLDIDTQIALRVDEAHEILNKKVASKLHLDVITTGINLGDFNYSGIEFIKKVRGLPDETTIAGGLRLRHIPIVVITGGGFQHALECLPEIDSQIPIINKGVSWDELIKTINEVMCRYKKEILSELQHIGMALVWQGGRYHIVDAYAADASSYLETKHLAGSPNSVGKSYSRLFLVADRWRLAQIAIDQFENLLNDSKTTESDLQKFLELHPEFLLRDEYDSFWAEPVLKSDATNRKIRPDFVLQPRAIRSNSWNWAIADLKRHDVPLLSHKRFHMDLSHHVHRVTTQLRDYEVFFADPRNQDVLKRRFGGVAPKPKLVAIIGRLPLSNKDEYAVLRSRIAGITITTYDEMLEFRRSNVERIKTLDTLI